MPTTVKLSTTPNSLYLEGDNRQRQTFDAGGNVVNQDFIRNETAALNLVWFKGETEEQRQDLINHVSALGPAPNSKMVTELIIDHGCQILGVEKEQLESARCLLSQTIAAKVGEQLAEKVAEKMPGKHLTFGNKKIVLSVNNDRQLTATAKFDQLALIDPSIFEPVPGSEEGELAPQSRPLPGTVTFQYTAPEPGVATIACPDIQLSDPDSIYPLLPEIKKSEKQKSFRKELVGGAFGSALFVTGLALFLIPGVNIISWLCFAVMALGLVIDIISAGSVIKNFRGTGLNREKGKEDISLETAPSKQGTNDFSNILTYEKKPPVSLSKSASNSGFFASGENEYTLPPAPVSSFFSPTENSNSQLGKTDSSTAIESLTLDTSH